MRTASLCVTVLAVALLFGNQAESQDVSAAERGFLEIEADAIVEPFEEEVELFQENTQATAKAFSRCGFAGSSRSEGTPLVVQGKNQVASLKVPAGSCVALFTHAGYNGATNEGQMLKIRGPMDIPCLESYTLKGESSNWMAATHAYKMGSCTAETSVEVATNAIESKAGIDLSALSHTAKAAEEGTAGTITHAYTRIFQSDGVAHPYSETTVPEAMETGMKVSTNNDKPASDVPPTHAPTQAPTEAPTESRTQQKDFEKTEIAKDIGITPPQPLTTTASYSSGIKPLDVDLPFPEKDDKQDVLKDVLKDAKKDEEKKPCDPAMGCTEPKPPCTDKSDAEVCEDYVARGDCQFEFAQKDCQKSCGLCPHGNGAVSSDAHVAKSGHYFLGANRRRVGAGYGRRRRTALKSDKKDKKDKKKITEEVPTKVSVLHPDGTKTVVVKKPAFKARPCTECVRLFKDARGCQVWKKGADPTSLVQEGCLHCAKDAAEACGMIKDKAQDNKSSSKTAKLPEPLQHPKAAAKDFEKNQDEVTKDAEAEVPKTMAKALKKVGSDSTPSTTDTVVAKLKKVAAVTTSADTPKSKKATSGETIAEAETAVTTAQTVAVEKSNKAADALATLATAEKAAATATAQSAQAAGTVAGPAVASEAAKEQSATKVLEKQAGEEVTTADEAEKNVKAAKETVTKVTTLAEQKASTPTEAQIIAKQADNWAAQEIKKESQSDKN